MSIIKVAIILGAFVFVCLDIYDMIILRKEYKRLMTEEVEKELQELEEVLKNAKTFEAEQIYQKYFNERTSKDTIAEAEKLEELVKLLSSSRSIEVRRIYNEYLSRKTLKDIDKL